MKAPDRLASREEPAAADAGEVAEVGRASPRSGALERGRQSPLRLGERGARWFSERVVVGRRLPLRDPSAYSSASASGPVSGRRAARASRRRPPRRRASRRARRRAPPSARPRGPRRRARPRRPARRPNPKNPAALAHGRRRQTAPRTASGAALGPVAGQRGARIASERAAEPASGPRRERPPSSAPTGPPAPRSPGPRTGGGMTASGGRSRRRRRRRGGAAGLRRRRPIKPRGGPLAASDGVFVLWSPPSATTLGSSPRAPNPRDRARGRWYREVVGDDRCPVVRFLRRPARAATAARTIAPSLRGLLRASAIAARLARSAARRAAFAADTPVAAAIGVRGDARRERRRRARQRATTPRPRRRKRFPPALFFCLRLRILPSGVEIPLPAVIGEELRGVQCPPRVSPRGAARRERAFFRVKRVGAPAEVSGRPDAATRRAARRRRPRRRKPAPRWSPPPRRPARGTESSRGSSRLLPPPTLLRPPKKTTPRRSSWDARALDVQHDRALRVRHEGRERGDEPAVLAA